MYIARITIEQGSGAEPELGAGSLLFGQFLQGRSWSQSWKQSDKEQWEEPNFVLALTFESWLLKAKELLLRAKEPLSRAREQLFPFFLVVWRTISGSGETILHPESRMLN